MIKWLQLKFKTQLYGECQYAKIQLYPKNMEFFIEIDYNTTRDQNTYFFSSDWHVPYSLRVSPF